MWCCITWTYLNWNHWRNWIFIRGKAAERERKRKTDKFNNNSCYFILPSKPHIIWIYIALWSGCNPIHNTYPTCWPLVWVYLLREFVVCDWCVKILLWFRQLDASNAALQRLPSIELWIIQITVPEINACNVWLSLPDVVRNNWNDPPRSLQSNAREQIDSKWSEMVCFFPVCPLKPLHSVGMTDVFPNCRWCGVLEVSK